MAVRRILQHSFDPPRVEEALFSAILATSALRGGRERRQEIYRGEARAPVSAIVAELKGIDEAESGDSSGAEERRRQQRGASCTRSCAGTRCGTAMLCDELSLYTVCVWRSEDK